MKGGVGKSTVTLGLAQALHRKGKRVGILDLDYRSPVIPLLMGADGASLGRTTEDALVPPVIDGISVMSMAFLWPDGKAVMVEDSLAVGDVRQILTPGVIAWPADLEYMVIDSPPSSSGIVLAILSLPEASGAILVSHPRTASRAALLRTLDLFAEKQMPIYGLVCNQGRDEVTQMPRYDLTEADLQHLAEQFKMPLFMTIPHATRLNDYFDILGTAVLAARPIILAPSPEPQGEKWQKIVELARKLTQQSTSAAS